MKKTEMFLELVGIVILLASVGVCLVLLFSLL